MKIYKGQYGWSTSAHSKNKDGSENKVYVDVQFPKGQEPTGETIDGKLIFKSNDGKETECFLSSYLKKDGTKPIKIVMLGKEKQIQQTLTGDGRDVLGHYDSNITFETDDLPFY